MIRTIVFDFGNVVAFFDHSRALKELAPFTDMDPVELALVLYRSPFLIAQPRASQAQEKIQGILERRRFDQETRRRAHQLAGQWDVDYLEKQYFGWIEREGRFTSETSRRQLEGILEAARNILIERGKT